jgi:hypothetical protein
MVWDYGGGKRWPFRRSQEVSCRANTPSELRVTNCSPGLWLHFTVSQQDNINIMCIPGISSTVSGRSKNPSSPKSNHLRSATWTNQSSDSAITSNSDWLVLSLGSPVRPTLFGSVPRGGRCPGGPVVLAIQGLLNKVAPLPLPCRLCPPFFACFVSGPFFSSTCRTGTRGIFLFYFLTFLSSFPPLRLPNPPAPLAAALLLHHDQSCSSKSLNFLVRFVLLPLPLLIACCLGASC